MAAADEERRRVVRDLHDGAQQRLVHTVITLKLARRAQHDGDPAAEALMGEALGHAERATTELRELSHGILPGGLARGGLRVGVDALLARVPLPVTADITEQRMPPAIEATAYFIVAEALTNVVKHSWAERAAVRAYVEGNALHVEVRDDGTGGARLESGTGLLGPAPDRWTLVWPCDACGGAELALLHRPSAVELAAGRASAMHAAGGDDCPGCETRARRLEADGTKPEIWFDTIVHSWVVRLPGAGADDGPILPLEIHWFDAPLGRVCQAAADLVFAGDALCEGDRG